MLPGNEWYIPWPPLIYHPSQEADSQSAVPQSNPSTSSHAVTFPAIPPPAHRDQRLRFEAERQHRSRNSQSRLHNGAAFVNRPLLDLPDKAGRFVQEQRRSPVGQGAVGVCQNHFRQQLQQILVAPSRVGGKAQGRLDCGDGTTVACIGMDRLLLVMQIFLSLGSLTSVALVRVCFIA